MDMQLTTKTQEALSTAMQMALVNGNPEVVPAHILLSLLQQGDEGIAVALLDAVGADRTALVAKARALVSALPSATGGDGPKPQLSRQGLTVMQTAQKVAAERGDEYISTEHVLIALSKDGGTEVTSALSAQGATPDALLDALGKVRGATRVTSADPEAPSRRWRSSALISRLARRKARWIPSSDVTARSDAWCKC